MISVGLTAKEFPDSLVFFDSLIVNESSIFVKHKDGIGKLPAGMMDIRDNIRYAKSPYYVVGDYIRSQGGQHNCYWKIETINNGIVQLHFFGQIRRFGSQDKTITTSGYQRNLPQQKD